MQYKIIISKALVLSTKLFACLKYSFKTILNKILKRKFFFFVKKYYYSLLKKSFNNFGGSNETFTFSYLLTEKIDIEVCLEINYV